MDTDGQEPSGSLPEGIGMAAISRTSRNAVGVAIPEGGRVDVPRVPGLVPGLFPVFMLQNKRVPNVPSPQAAHEGFAYLHPDCPATGNTRNIRNTVDFSRRLPCSPPMTQPGNNGAEDAKAKGLDLLLQ